MHINYSVMTAKKFTLQEQIFLITCCYSLSCDFVLLREECFPNTGFPLCQILRDMHKKFQRTGLVDDTPRSGGPCDARTEFKRLVVVTLSTASNNTHFSTVSCTYKLVFCHYLQRFH